MNQSEPTPTRPCRDYSSLQSIPQKDQDSSQASKTYDYYIYADGSGYTDHIGGFGAIVLSSKHPEMTYEPSCGSSTHMETGRAEFMAILTALHSIVDVSNMEQGSLLKHMKMHRPTVLVTSDRQDLVGSINNLYRRQKNGDLWAQFLWFEQYFEIEARHIHRDTNAVHNVVDAIASEMRLVMVDFINIQKESKHI